MNKIEKSESESIDYIYRLPESVVHHILSFLDFKHIVRTCVLSKTWNLIWSSYPNICFYSPYNKPNYPKMESMMEQCLYPKVWIQNMQVMVSVHDMVDKKELAPYMDRWLRAAFERNVSELVVNLSLFYAWGSDPNRLYPIPREFVIARSLRVLDLEGIAIEDSLARVELPQLWKLNIERCHFVGENALNMVVSGCPGLEVLRVIACEGVGKFLSISSKPRFKYFSMWGAKELNRIEILTPSLETFKLCLMGCCVVDLDSCVALKHMEFDRVFLCANYVDIQNLLSKLHYIESLELKDCRVVDKIKISSPCLKRLIMGYCKNFLGAEFNLPNLSSLECDLDGEFYSDNEYSSWNVPMLDEILIVFNGQSLQTFRGLKCFLEKVHRYEDLELLIECNGGRSYIRLSLISSSRQSIELLHERLSNETLIKEWFSSPLRLVSMEEIEHEMNSECKSFLKSFSMGYQTATIILHEKELEESDS